MLNRRCEKYLRGGEKCGGMVRWTFISGEKVTRVCDLCLKDMLFELISNNDSISFGRKGKVIRID